MGNKCGSRAQLNEGAEKIPDAKDSDILSSGMSMVFDPKVHLCPCPYCMSGCNKDFKFRTICSDPQCEKLAEKDVFPCHYRCWKMMMMKDEWRVFCPEHYSIFLQEIRETLERNKMENKEIIRALIRENGEDPDDQSIKDRQYCNY